MRVTVARDRPRYLSRPAGRVPRPLLALVGVVVLAQLAYPLLHGSARDLTTIVIVIAFAASCTAHAAVSRGVAFGAVVLVLTAGLGFAVEIVGVHTQLPFGRYTYGTQLGPRWFGVPPVIALAWTMLAWPSAVVARLLVRGRAARVVLGGWALAVTDLFLDPQMVHAGYWSWRDTDPHLPGVDRVPLTNYLGWLVVALIVSAALQLVLDRHPGPADDRVAIGLYLWLYVGWVVALGVFLGLPAAAGWGALGMGTVALPAVVLLRR